MNVIICTTWTSPIRPKHSACFGHLGRLDIWIKPWFKWYFSANGIKMVLVNSAPEPVIYFKESPNQVRETRFSLKSVNMMQPRTDKRPEAINVQVWNISSSFSSLNLVLLLCLVFLPKICYPYGIWDSNPAFLWCYCLWNGRIDYSGICGSEGWKFLNALKHYFYIYWENFTHSEGS